MTRQIEPNLNSPKFAIFPFLIKSSFVECCYQTLYSSKVNKFSTKYNSVIQYILYRLICYQHDYCVSHKTLFSRRIQTLFLVYYVRNRNGIAHLYVVQKSDWRGQDWIGTQQVRIGWKNISKIGDCKDRNVSSLNLRQVETCADMMIDAKCFILCFRRRNVCSKC